MIKKVISAALLFMILTSFTACGQKGSTAGKDTEAAPETTAKAAAEVPADSGSGSSVEAVAEADSGSSVEAASETSRTGQSSLTSAPEDQTADVPASPDPLPAEEQRRILEENRSLWSFDEDDYSPDWYYAFTDLDHNGLLEVLSASTQGSGIFTCAHFYEVLPDGSGVSNLYHTDMEIEGIDDWPEIIMESIPSYYDKNTDRFYYVCTNNTRDGAGHAVSQPAALCLKDGVAEWEYLALMDTQITEEGEQTTWQDGKGNPITEEDYSKVVDSRFAGMELSEFRPQWTAVTAK